MKKVPRKPSYNLINVKRLLKASRYIITPKAADSARDFFGWHEADIVRCLLKLNDRYHKDDPAKNHFHKTVPHFDYPHTMMDYYKAINIMDGFNVYTHICINPTVGKVEISSLKEI